MQVLSWDQQKGLLSRCHAFRVSYPLVQRLATRGLFSSGYMDKLRSMHASIWWYTHWPVTVWHRIASSTRSHAKLRMHCVKKIHVKSLYNVCSTIIYYSVQRQLDFGTRVQYQEVTDMFIPICWYCHRNYLVYKVSYWVILQTSKSNQRQNMNIMWLYIDKFDMCGDYLVWNICTIMKICLRTLHLGKSILFLGTTICRMFKYYKGGKHYTTYYVAHYTCMHMNGLN
jgi:hypothetical protein